MEETKEEIKQEGDFKIKKKPGRPRKLTSQKEPVKLDLNKTKEQDAVQAQETSDSDVAVEEKKDETGSAEVVEEVRDAEEVKPTE
jgi:hypothetical protein